MLDAGAGEKTRDPVTAGRKHVRRWVAVCCGARCRSRPSRRTLYVLDISRGIHDNNRLISWAVGLFSMFHDRFLDPDRCAPIRIQNSIPDRTQKSSLNLNVKNN